MYFFFRNIDDIGLLIGNQLNCNDQYVLNNLTAIGLQVKAVLKSEINNDICFNFNSPTSSICLKVLNGKENDRNGFTKNRSSKRKQEGSTRVKNYKGSFYIFCQVPSRIVCFPFLTCLDKFLLLQTYWIAKNAIFQLYLVCFQ